MSVVEPIVFAIAGRTSAGSWIVASRTQKTPFLKSRTSSDAASIESRVFPDPPGRSA